MPKSKQSGKHSRTPKKSAKMQTTPSGQSTEQIAEMQANQTSNKADKLQDKETFMDKKESMEMNSNTANKPNKFQEKETFMEKQESMEMINNSDVTGAKEELTLTSSDAKLECDACVVKFADNGGCELALSGEDPGRAIPEGCDSCGDQAEKFCMNERDGGAEIIPPKDIAATPNQDVIETKTEMKLTSSDADFCKKNQAKIEEICQNVNSSPDVDSIECVVNCKQSQDFFSMISIRERVLQEDLNFDVEMKAKIKTKPGKADAVKTRATSEDAKEEISNKVSTETNAVVDEIKTVEVPQTTATPTANSSTKTTQTQGNDTNSATTATANSSTRAPQAQGNDTNTATTTTDATPSTVSTATPDASNATNVPGVETQTTAASTANSSTKAPQAQRNDTNSATIVIALTSNDYTGVNASTMLLIGLAAFFIMH